MSSHPLHFEKCHPNAHDLLVTKAESLRQQGLADEARFLVSSVIDENPDHPEALLVAGIIEAQSDPAAAALRLESHLRLQPDSVEGLFWLGVVCYRLGRYEEAVRHLQALSAVTPDVHYVHRHLGRALEALNRNDEALESYAKALQLSSANAEIHTLIGILHAKRGDFDEAIGCFQRALAENPAYQPVHVCLARALVSMNRDDEAYTHYQEALKLAPVDCDAMVYLATLLIKTSNVDDAERLLLKAQHLNPEHAGVFNALGRVRNTQGRAGEAVAAFQRGYALDPARKEIASNLLFSLNYLPGATPEDVAEQHFRISEELYPPGPHPVLEARRPARHGGPLRIGYISADFHTHSVSSFFEPILLNHDRNSFLPFLYYGKGVEDDTTGRLRSLAFQWRRTVGLTAEAVADMIEADGIDILVDLSGHSGMNRLDVCALRPAPVQVSWIGYPHSTGMRQIDYYLSDTLCDPAGMTDHLYCEEVYRLPRIFCVYTLPMEFPPVNLAAGSQSADVTFGCFNNFAKTNDPLFSLWADILKAVPGSRLALKSSALAEGSSTHQRVRGIFSRLGVSPERISAQVVKKSQYDHLDQYSGIDIALDTYPYHGTTTTCEALWMGVPVVTLAGKCHAARVGVSLLTSVGLDDLIAGSPEEYVATAVRLANDRSRRALLRENLRLMMARSPLMDAAGVTRDVEAAYLRMTEGRRNR